MTDQPDQQADPHPATGQGGRRPLVSVLVAVYKPAEEYLRRAIESVLEQTYTHFELLLLDDCPGQRSDKVILSYNDPRIRYVQNERNLGISESRNKLVALAKGEFLAIFDHDDICMPERLQKQVDYLLQHPDVGVVSGLRRNLPKGEVPFLPEDDHDIKVQLMDGCTMAHSASMIRRELFDIPGIRYEEVYTPAEDYRLWAKLIPHTRFHNIQEVLLEYRLHELNTSKLQDRKITLATIAIRADMQKEQPLLYQEFLLSVVHVTRVRFLGIPLLKIETHRDKTGVYLFSCLPIMQIKKKLSIH